LASRRQTRRLKIIPGPRSDMKRGLSIPSSDILPDSPTSQSLCSSATRSSPSSAAVSPIADTVLLPASPKGTTQQSGLLHMAQAEYRPKRSRSLASNVKSLFQTGSLPPLEFGRQDPDERKHPNRSSTTVTPGLFRRWIGPNHRRVRSVPDHLKTPIPNTGLSEYRLQMNLGSKSTLSVHVPIAASEPFDPDFGQGLSYVHSISSAVVHTPNG
jgi:hypothetical protein